MYQNHNKPTPRRNPGDPPRTVVNTPPIDADPVTLPSASYIYDEDGVIIRTGREDAGQPIPPVVPSGYGVAVWSEDNAHWYAPRLSRRYKSSFKTVPLYSPNDHDLQVSKEILDACVARQQGRCYITGRKFRKGMAASLIRLDVLAPLVDSNLVAVEKWMLDSPEPVNIDLLQERWENRETPTRKNNAVIKSQSLPF